MPVDPQVAAHYAAVKAVGGNPAPLSIQEIRLHADQVYNDQRKFPPVHQVQELSIPCPWGTLPLRLYRPSPAEGLPVLLFFHGGGFCIHNIASHDSLCRKLALECGCAVLNVGYRLAPEDPFPACMEDGYTALDWVYHNAPALRLDGSRIAVARDSAGASISAVVSLLSRDRNGPRVSLQILAYGSSGILPNEESPSYQALIDHNPVLSRAFTTSVFDAYAGGADPGNPYLNPGRAQDLSRLPRTFSITAEYDPLRDDGEAFAQALEQAGNQVRLLRVPGVYHGFLLLWEKFDIARQVIGQIAQEVRDTFSR